MLVKDTSTSKDTRERYIKRQMMLAKDVPDTEKY